MPESVIRCLAEPPEACFESLIAMGLTAFSGLTASPKRALTLAGRDPL